MDADGLGLEMFEFGFDSRNCGLHVSGELYLCIRVDTLIMRFLLFVFIFGNENDESDSGGLRWLVAIQVAAVIGECFD